jgi:rubrerythrin
MKTQANAEITNIEKKQLMKAQQGELDAVILYRKLAENVKDANLKKTFLKIATDEGKHASILRKYTNEILKPKNTKALVVISIYKVLGLRFTMKVLGKGELNAAKEYFPLVKKFPNIQEIINDEELHGELMKNMLS